MGKKKHRKHGYTASEQDKPLATAQIITASAMAAVWFGGAWHYAGGSWGLWFILVIVLIPFMYLFTPTFAAIGLIISVTIESLSHKLAASRKVQHVNTSRPYDLTEIRQRARQAAGLSDEA